jgi:hypothetical protein
MSEVGHLYKETLPFRFKDFSDDSEKFLFFRGKCSYLCPFPPTAALAVTKSD